MSTNTFYNHISSLKQIILYNVLWALLPSMNEISLYLSDIIRTYINIPFKSLPLFDYLTHDFSHYATITYRCW